MRWRPLLTFYENRIPILREFENGGDMRAFAVGEDHVAARFLDAEHVLTIRQDSLTVELFGQDVDQDAICAFADAALERLGPIEARGASVHFRYIVPLSSSFEDAVAASVRHFQLPTVDTIQFADWSFLVDLVSQGEAGGQIEYGIIRAHEAVTRLSGAGRIGPQQTAAAVQRWAGTTFPAVAMFAHCAWVQAGARIPEEDAPTFWRAARDRVSGLVDALYATIGVDDEQQREEQTG